MLCRLYVPDVDDGLKGSIWDVSGLDMSACLTSTDESWRPVLCNPQPLSECGFIELCTYVLNDIKSQIVAVWYKSVQYVYP